jgi:imidazolonepropionase-like amidohydrolase
MNVVRGSAFLTTVLFAAMAPVRQPSNPADLVITHVRVIDATGAGAIERSVVVRHNPIDALLPTSSRPPAATVVVDGTGKFLIPGLWDMHAHVAARPEPSLAERVMLPLFLAHGVVGVRDMGGPLERVLALRERINQGTLAGPRILTPGPFIDGPGEVDPLFRRAQTAAEARAAVRELATAGVDFVKVQANLSREAYDAVVAQAHETRIPLAGHVPVAISAIDVVNAGQRSIEHISPALVGDAGLLFACSSREADLRRELLSIEHDRTSAPAEIIRTREAALRRQLVETYSAERARALGALIRSHGSWIVPTLIWSTSFRPLSATDTSDAVPLDYVPAATRTRWRQAHERYLKAAGPEDFEANTSVARTAAAAVGALHKAGAHVLAGTDTFDYYVLPGVSLHQELALLVGAGLSTMEALQAATRNAADYRGTLAQEGTIERGKRADLVLLDGNPLAEIHNTTAIRAVVIGGRLVSREEIDRMLASVKNAARD